jgi:3-mercaptopyruvate sulfurtransferase SseA
LDGDLGKRLIVFCNEGYQSSLVAATLKDLGFMHASDLVGGFQAWRAAGLPVQPSPDQAAAQAAAAFTSRATFGISERGGGVMR